MENLKSQIQKEILACLDDTIETEIAVSATHLTVAEMAQEIILSYKIEA